VAQGAKQKIMPLLSQGPSAPGTIVQDSSGTKSWLNLSNAALDDGASFASVSLSSLGDISNLLKATNFGFNLPSTATPAGVVFTYKGKATHVADAGESIVRLIKSGTAQGQDKAVNTYGLSLTSYSFGSSSDLWALSFLSSDFNASNFGIALSVSNVSFNNAVSVDAFRLTVYYNVPSTKFILTTQGMDV
jgi:hypothetical protein